MKLLFHQSSAGKDVAILQTIKSEISLDFSNEVWAFWQGAQKNYRNFAPVCRHTTLVLSVTYPLPSLTSLIHKVKLHTIFGFRGRMNHRVILAPAATGFPKGWFY